MVFVSMYNLGFLVHSNIYETKYDCWWQSTMIGYEPNTSNSKLEKIMERKRANSLNMIRDKLEKTKQIIQQVQNIKIHIFGDIPNKD